MKSFPSKFFSENRKSKTCPESYRRIQNRKLLGIVALVGTLAMCGAVVQAQQPTKIPRIGYVGPATTDPRTASFRQGLRDLGYTEAKNILVEYRYVGGKVDRYPDIVAELVQLNVDVLVAVPFQAILAAKPKPPTSTQPEPEPDDE